MVRGPGGRPGRPAVRCVTMANVVEPEHVVTRPHCSVEDVVLVQPLMRRAAIKNHVNQVCKKIVEMLTFFVREHFIRNRGGQLRSRRVILPANVKHFYCNKNYNLK